MLLLALQLTLGQLLPAPPPPPPDPMKSWEPPPEPKPAETAPAPEPAVTPPAPEDEPNPEAPPPGYQQQKRPEGPSRLARGAASTGGGVLGGIAALGIASGIGLSNARLDTNFANAAIASIMIAGVSFTVQHAMGGHGEVIFALLGSIVMMACALSAAQALDPSGIDVAWLTTAFGALPGAIASVVLLEASSPERSSISMSAGPGSLLVRF
jgi:hypothetical protein